MILAAAMNRNARARLFLLVEAAVMFLIAGISFASFADSGIRRHVGFLLGGTILANAFLLKLIQRFGDDGDEKRGRATQ